MLIVTFRDGDHEHKQYIYSQEKPSQYCEQLRLSGCLKTLGSIWCIKTVDEKDDGSLHAPNLSRKL